VRDLAGKYQKDRYLEGEILPKKIANQNNRDKIWLAQGLSPASSETAYLALNGRGEGISKLETGRRSRDIPHLSERSPYYFFLLPIYIVAFFIKNVTLKKNIFAECCGYFLGDDPKRGNATA
jgi:hypothetical protein